MNEKPELGSLGLSDLQRIWKARPAGGWADRPDLYAQLGEQVLRIGEPLVAYDMLNEGCKYQPRNVRLRQLLGLALSRSGAVERGNAVLRGLTDDGQSDGETLGILAGTHKALWVRAPDQRVANVHLDQANKVYRQAYAHCLERDEIEAAFYNGINAATTALLMDAGEEACKLARDVDGLCEQTAANATEEADLYWLLATRGEAALIGGQLSRAEEFYGQATAIRRGRYADVAATRRQARLILAHHGLDQNVLDEVFKLPPVVVFAGCETNTLEPDSQTLQALRRATRAKLRELGAGFGYSTLNGLPDLVFVEELNAMGGEAHVVMPLSLESFLHRLGADPEHSEWTRRYHLALESATQIHGTIKMADIDSPDYRGYAQRVLDGLGRLHSDTLESEFALMALSRDGQPIFPRSMAGRWKACKDDVVAIEIGATDNLSRNFSRPEHDDSGSRQIKALLFADVVGYSGIREPEIPLFVEHFFGAVADLVSRTDLKPAQKSTWGDAVYLVFDEIEDAALFALQLSSMVAETDWNAKGLSSTLDLRIALHAGPVYLCEDPVMKKSSFCGSHVTWTARIEPCTPPGLVYASQPFAALVKSQGITSVACDYVGHVPLAKHFGNFPLYHVRPASGPANHAPLTER